MTDVLIRNVPEEDVRRIDEKAQRMGLSRNEFLKRYVVSEAARQAPTEPPTVESFQRLAELTSDVLDEDVMRRAWS